jgi:hypothetical protein
MSWTLISTGTTLQVNQKYLVNSSGGSFTLVFPNTPSIGDEIVIADAADFTLNPVSLSSILPFSDETDIFVLNNSSSQFQFVFDGSQWLIYNISRLGTKITSLPSTTTQQISDNDLLLYINEDSGLFESGSITYQNLKSAITNNSFTSVEQIINSLNSFTGSPVLNVSSFGNNTPAYYLNYENFTNKPLIPLSVSQLNNDLGFVSNLTSFTTDNLEEGVSNRYFSEERFDELFGPAFENSFRLFSGDFSETQVFDSLDDVSGTPFTTSQATNVINVASSVIDFFAIGQNLRIFGGNIDTTNVTVLPTINGITKNGFAGATGVNVRYRLAHYEFSTGKISARSNQSDVITNINFELFNQVNNVQISFNRTGTNYGILVYRQIDSGAFSLIDILGQKQLGSVTTNITYIDFGTFNYTPWSLKNASTDNYVSTTGLLHFPLAAPTSPLKGWVNAVISEVDKDANQIILTNSFNFESQVVICQDDTQAIQAAINQRVNAGIDSLTLNDRRYMISRLSIPTNFTLAGKGRSSLIKKLPWSTETDNRIIRMSSSIASNVLLSNFDIDGNMQNQWLKSDAFDEFANYAIDMKQNNETFNAEKIRIRNVIGGGIAARRPTSMLVNLCRVENSGMSDFYSYSPLVADDGKDVIVTNNVFKNFTDSIDLSVTENGVFSGNAVENVGTGVVTFGSRFFISSPNVLRGPAGEFIPGPDILNSIFDAVNITLQPGTVFTSDVYKYQENGINFDLTANRATLSLRSDKLRKVDNVEELYGEVLIGGNTPLQRIFDVALEPTEGEFKFSISSSAVDQLLTTFSFSSLKAVDPNHVGLVYSAALTEYVPSGTITGTPTANNTLYTVTLRNFSNIALGSRVRLLNHGGTPNLDNLVGTITNINNTLQFSNPPEITVTIQYGQNITAVGSGGSITVENTFILAKGRIL